MHICFLQELLSFLRLYKIADRLLYDQEATIQVYFT